MLRAIAFGLVGYLIGAVIIRVATPYENGLTATDPANVVRTKVWDTSPIDEWAFDSTQPPLPGPIGPPPSLRAMGTASRPSMRLRLGRWSRLRRTIAPTRNSALSGR
jgi:hypothetical protein